MVATVTPYITPQMLVDAPTGCSWSILPEPGATVPAQQAEITNVCNRATSIVDTYCNQMLRASVDNEELFGPGSTTGRAGIQRGTGNGLLIMRRWPVIDVLALQTARNAGWPRTYVPVESGLYAPEHPLINWYTDTAAPTVPDGAPTISTAPDIVHWRWGRNGVRLLASYTNGWPHSSLTSAAESGAMTLNVDDVTGFTGASAMVYDGAQTETVSIASVAASSPLALPNGVGIAQTGPGVLTLNSPLANPHDAGVAVSSLPANVIWASVLAAAVQSLEGGIIAITIQSMPGSTSTGGKGVSDMQAQYKDFLTPYMRRS